MAEDKMEIEYSTQEAADVESGLEQEESDRNASLADLLDNDAVVEQKKTAGQGDGNYRNIYAGTTLDNAGLYRLSAAESIRLVVVAGSSGSGKTTLETIFYYLFHKGLNKVLSFAGSQTILGYTGRSSGLKVDSGNEKPQMAHTSRGLNESYLHLALVDEQTGKRENLIFLDLAGETFMNANNLNDCKDILSGADVVMVLLDGEKLCNPPSRKNVFSSTNTIMHILIKQKIISEDTNLQVICTKKDKIDACAQKDRVYQILEKQREILEKNYSDYAANMEFSVLSALDFENEHDKLEELLVKCMTGRPKRLPKDGVVESELPERHFDRFWVRG